MSEKLGALVNIVSGYALKSNLFSDNPSLNPVVRIRDIDKGSTTTFTSEKIPDEKFVVKEGDILIAMDGEFKVAVWKGKNSYLNQRVCKIEPKDGRLLKSYLFYFLPKELKRIEDITPFVTVKHLSVNDIASINITVPSLKTQLQIATALDKAQSIIDKRKNNLKLLDHLLRDIFLDMFGDPLLNSKKWPEESLDNLVKKDKPITYGIVQAGPHIENGVPYIKSGDIRDGKILINQLSKTSQTVAKDYDRSTVRTGDIVFSIRASVGASAILPKELDGANLTQGTARISVNEKINNYFLNEQLQTKGFKQKIQRLVKGTTFKEITLERLRSIKVFVPNKKLQEQFAKTVISIEEIKNKNLQSLQQSEILFQSLLQKAFKGELEFPMNVEEHIEKGLPLTRDLPVSKPLELKTESFSSLLQKTTENYNFLKERVESYAEEKPVQALQRIIENLLKRIGKIKTEAQLISLLEKNKLPGIQSLSDIKKIREWFEQYDVYSHEGGRFQLDIISAVRNNILSCREGLQQLLKENNFFLFSKQTMAFAQAIAKEVEQAVTKTEEEYEAEIIRYSGGDPASLFLDDKKDIDTITVAEAKLSLLQAIGENHVQNFGIQDLKTALEDELSFSGYNNKGLSYEEVRQGVYNFIDQFLISEFNNQPFTFFQLQQALAAIDFTPSFELLNDYIFDSLQTKHPLLKQAYFDEQMRNVNEEAYQYLLNTMDSRLMGPDTFTPPRRMFLIYGLPTVKISNAT